MSNAIPSYCYAIEAVNVLILIILGINLAYAIKRAHAALTKDLKIEYNFYITIFALCGFFMISNTFAFLRAHIAYFIMKMKVPDELYIATWSDRVGMLFAYSILYFLSRGYLINWFFKK